MEMFGKTLPKSVVLKYYLFRAAGSPGFFLPIYIVYLLSNDVTFTEIGLIGMIQSVVVVGGEMPTGYVGDRIGRRNSLLVAQVLFGVSIVGLVVSENFLGFAVAFAIFSFARTFVSGSDRAWLYDALKETLDEDTFTYVQGRGTAIRQWVMAATMVLGGFLYVVDPIYPFLAALGMRAITFGVILSMPQNAQYADEDGEDEQNNGQLTVLDALPLIREKLTEPPLRSFVAYVALFIGVQTTVGAFIQPIAEDTLEANLGALFSSFGVPEVASLGVLYASFTAVSALASDRSSDLEAALGVRKSMLVVPVVTGLLFVVPAFVPILAFPMFFASRASRALIGPIVGQFLNDRIESVGRATVLSAVSMVYALTRIPFSVGSGVVADAFSPLVAVAGLGGFFLVVGGGLFLWREPVRSDTGTTTPEGAASE